MINEETMNGVFDKIVGDKELAKRAIKNPAEVFAELGLDVCDDQLVNDNIFEAVPELKKHFLATIAGTGGDNPRMECPSPKCIVCKAGIITIASAAIVAAMAGFPEDMPLIEALAELVGLDAEVVEEIIEEAVKDGLSITGVAKKICQALGTC